MSDRLVTPSSRAALQSPNSQARRRVYMDFVAKPPKDNAANLNANSHSGTRRAVRFATAAPSMPAYRVANSHLPVTPQSIPTRAGSQEIQQAQQLQELQEMPLQPRRRVARLVRPSLQNTQAQNAQLQEAQSVRLAPHHGRPSAASMPVPEPEPEIPATPVARVRRTASRPAQAQLAQPVPTRSAQSTQAIQLAQTAQKAAPAKSTNAAPVTRKVATNPVTQRRSPQPNTQTITQKIVPEVDEVELEQQIAQATGSIPKSAPTVSRSANTTPKSAATQKAETPKTDEPEKTAPNANNYSLGVRSPFIRQDAVVEKRPLGTSAADYTPADRASKNEYASRKTTPASKAAPSRRTTVKKGAKQQSSWLSAIIVVLIVAAGGGLGFLLWLIISRI